jgi:hypothetical protein
MKKIYFSILSVILLSIGAQAQNITKGVAFSTGGSFMAPGNHVKLYAMETDSFGSWVVDSIPGDFSNQVVVESHFAYVHVGRAGGNPAGMDRIYKYDLLVSQTSSPIDSTLEIPGIQSFEISGDRIIISKGYPASANFVEVVDKYDLQNNLYTDNAIMAGCAGISIMNNKAYIASTDFVVNAGEVHIIDLGSAISNEGSIILDTLSTGAAEIFAENGMVYLTNKRYRPDYSTWYAGVTTLNLTDSTFSTDTTGLTAAKGFDFYNSMILGNFGAPLETYDIANGTRNTLFNDYCSAAKKDPNGNHYVVQNTDFFSVGSISVFDATGTVMGTASTDISGTALAIATNNLPTAVNDTLVNPTFSGVFLTIDAMVNDYDMDGDVFQINKIVAQATNGIATVGAVNIGYEATVVGAVADSFSYMITDVWGDSSIATVYLTFPTSVNEVNASSTSIYPNPANNVVNITAENGTIDTIQIIDLSGRTVIVTNSSNMNETINVSELNTGVYFVKVSINGNVETHRLIIQ